MIEATSTYVPTSIGERVDDTATLPPIAPPQPEPAAPPAPPASATAPQTTPVKRASSAEILAVLGTGLAIFGAIVVLYVAYLFAGTALEHGRAQHTMRMRYANMLGNSQAYTGGVIPPGSPVFALDIPHIGVHQIVAEGTTGRILQKGPGHLRTS